MAEIFTKKIANFVISNPKDLFGDFLSNIFNPDYFHVAMTHCWAMAYCCEKVAEEPDKNYLNYIHLMDSHGIPLINVVRLFYGYWFAKLERKPTSKA